MASISTDANGNRTVQFVGEDKKRRSIRLGKVPKRIAEQIKNRVEHIDSMKRAKISLDGETAAWIAGLGDEMASKLAAVGLIPGRSSESVGEFCLSVIDRRRRDRATKPATVVNLVIVTNDIRRFFGDATALRTIKTADAERFHTHYHDRSLAPATVSRRLTTVRMIFELAAKLGLIESNPFAEISSRSHIPNERRYYLPMADFEKLIRACHARDMVLILALSRLAGLRCPSEVLTLRWSDVDLAAGKMLIRSPKTEHLPGKEERICPVFAPLRPYLDAAEREGEYVLGGENGDRLRQIANSHAGWRSVNLRERMVKLIRRAGLNQWPRIFHTLRASCETDLAREFPLHVVAAWLGNTPSVAVKHYLQVIDADFQRAVQIPVQSVAISQNPTLSDSSAIQQNGKVGMKVNEMEYAGNSNSVGVEGFEPTSESPTDQAIIPFVKPGGADPGAELRLVLKTWPILPPDVRAGIMAMVRSFARNAA